jgi:small subunit ribosomal protein S4
MRYTGPRNRLARRNAVDLELKTFGSKSHSNLMRKLTTPPGEHGANTRRKVSEHAKQLREKQKLRFMFGLSERQMGNHFEEAKRTLGNTGKFFCEALESRLDNVVYRSGFAPTRAAARQLVSHGHINVNDRKLTVASYAVKVGETVSFKKESSSKIPAIENALARKDIQVATWIKRDGLKATVLQTPSSETVEKLINMRLIIEFYSK